MTTENSYLISHLNFECRENIFKIVTVTCCDVEKEKPEKRTTLLITTSYTVINGKPSLWQ